MEKTFLIKPIETLYKGVLFRSRTEARWAVFFDSCNIHWHYEFEGFKLGFNKIYYLPDFYLPEFENGCFAEVKGEKFTDKEYHKCILLSMETKKTTLLLEGPPDLKALRVIYFEGNTYCEINAIPNADQAENENRLYLCPGYENNDLTIPEDYYVLLGNTFLNAVIKAKSYRF